MVETYHAIPEHIQDHEHTPVEASLFDHYSIDNEVELLRKIDHLSFEEQRFYIRENMLGFLGEYAGRIPYKKISYIMKDGTFDFAGIKMRDTYRNVQENVAIGSREWSETVGMLEVEDKMQDENINVATVLSPPKIDNYSFAFHFAKGTFNPSLGGVPIAEYILRYPERMNTIENSKKIAKSLTLETVDERFTSTNDFLANPFLSYSLNPEIERARLLELAGIDRESIQKSHEFEKLITRELMPWIDQYFSHISDLKFVNPASETHQVLKSDAELLLGALYNRARMLREKMDSNKYETINYTSDSASYSLEMVQQFAKSMPLTVTGGSCPVVKKDGVFGSAYLSLSDVYQELLNGNTISSIVDKEPFECPKCHHKTYESVGNQCPSCKLTKEQAEEEGYITC